ncbi:hypothetical protein [Halomonas sp. LBP4]|uniref:hypothetical protein n=1 Tax=Halomonas sp. LBP4 TaxID=2044917 RepID=UPI0015E8BC2C|nr:hypothetical protein [Halomonas sp. LBP4]
MEALATAKTISIFPTHSGRQLALEQFPSLAGDLPVRDGVRLAITKEHDHDQ